MFAYKQPSHRFLVYQAYQLPKIQLSIIHFPLSIYNSYLQLVIINW